MALALGLVFALAACGQSDEDKASDAAVAFVEAESEADGEAACALMTEDFMRSSGGPTEKFGCADVVARFSKGLGTLDFPEATNVSLNGDEGEVEVETSGPTLVVDVEKEGDEWKVANAQGSN